MIFLRTLFLDGTPLADEISVAEFSPLHPEATLSWAIDSDAPGGSQAWYEADVLDMATGDTLFSSGRVATAVQSATFKCAGFPAGARILARVTVGAADGGEASDAAVIFNGSLSDFPGEWISSSEDKGLRVLRFWKDFRLDKPVASAVLYTCGIGCHKAYLNGEETDDAFLDPAISNYAKLCYYRANPSVGDFLESGANRIEVQVAAGWRNNSSALLMESVAKRGVEFFGRTQLKALLRIAFEDGTTRDIATGPGWSCAEAPEEAGIFAGETFDASRNLFPELLKGVPATVVPPPGGVLRPMTIPPVREQETYAPVEITQPRPGVFVVDFGQNIAGVVRLALPDVLEAGQKIVIRHAEELDEDGTLYTAPLRGAAQRDTYIAAGDGRDLDQWQPAFTYHGFRYCEVSGLDRLGPCDILAVALHTDIRSRSSFSCGSAALNAIQKMVVMTEKANIHSILTDCPQRDERMGWMNDATVRFEETPFNFDVSRLFPKVMADIRAEQRPDGAFTCTAPFLLGSHPADPVCSSYLMAAKQALLHYGEIGVVAEFFDSMAAWEDYLLSRSPDGIVDYSYYGDWAGPEYACNAPEDPTSAVTPGPLMSTGYSYFNCVTLADFARRLGRRADEAKFSAAAERVRGAFLAKWFDQSSARVGTGSMGAAAFALWLGILPPESEAAVARAMRDDLVARGYQFTTGNLATRYLVDMLAKFGYADDALALLEKQTYPSFGFMMQNEATTVWERFELKKNPSMNSHDHPMYGAVGSWFYSALCGIEPVEPGFARVAIRPVFPEKLLSAHAVVETVMGELSVRWSRRYGMLRLFVQIPFGMAADLDFQGEKRALAAGYHVFSECGALRAPSLEDGRV